MSHRNQKGFTIVELITIIAVVGILMTVISQVFVAGYESYFNLQEDSLRNTEVSSANQRVGRVLRTLNSITKAESHQLEGFAYFTPRDTTLSKIRYYFDDPSDQLKAGIIPATGTAPNYTYNPADEHTVNILKNVDGSQPIFVYLNLDFQPTTFLPENYKDIKAIKINLANGKSEAGLQAIRVQTTITIRNRKTNL